MARLREITYSVPLALPIETQALIAESDGPWRLVVFPGTPCDLGLFDRFLAEAPKALEVVVIARPGFGRGHDRPYTSFDDQIAAARRFFEDGKQVVTLGVSYGGELALKAALDFPHAVQGAVTVAALFTEPRGYVLPFAELAATPVIREVLPRKLRHSRAELAGRRSQIGPLIERLKSYPGPVRILHGDLDHLVALSDARRLHGVFGPTADVDLEVVRGGTHFLEKQTPMRLYAAVAAVIKASERVKAKDDV